MMTHKQLAIVNLFAMGLATLLTASVAYSMDDLPDTDAIASIPLEDEIPNEQIRTPRSMLPATEPTTQSAAIEPLPFLTGDWNGTRRKLIDRGITLEATATLEGTRNFSGGIQPRNTGQYLFNAYLTLDTEKLIDVKGGTFYVNFQNHGGESASLKSTGDWQWLSNIDARETTQVSEVWYQQSALDGVIKCKLGKIDAWGDFANCGYAAEFLNSGMGYPVSQGLLPTYPDPAFGGEIIVTPNERFSASLGVFDGSLQEGVKTGRLGPATLWGEPSDLFLIAELGTRWKIESRSLPGGLFVGATYHTGTFDKFDGGKQDGAAGAYLTLQQRLWLETPSVDDDPKGVTCFLSLDWADPSVSEVDWHASAGVAWTGAIPKRDEDVIGLGLSTVWFSGDAGLSDSSESALEAFYKLQLTPSVSTWFDVQYIVDPGGSGADNALVGSVRLQFSL